MSRRREALAVALAAALPRLAAVAFERGDILASFTEKSDDFARVFVDSGTFGFVPGVPSAYTQPLYSFFLVPLYWIFGRHWLVVGLAQTAVAVATALLVLAIGRRALGRTGGLLAALAATLSPYLVWHDVHVNREILDGLVAVALVLLTLRLGERVTLLRAGAVGVVAGIAILGNSRLAALPLLLVAYLAWRAGLTRRAAAGGLVLLVAAALVIAPWAVRNRVEVGCLAITTDSRALWKANNEQTYDVLASGRWIDDVTDPPGLGISPQTVGDEYARSGRIIALDECELMRDYQELVFDFWREHPGEKARLAAQATWMLWDPRVTSTEGRPGQGTWLDTGRGLAAPVYTGALYALALVGLWAAPRSLSVLVLALLGYQTLAAMLFAGATRYRAPWDFLVALLAAAGALALARRRRQRRGSA